MTEGGLGAPEHIGLIVPDLESAMAELAALGHRWSSVATPTARIRRNGEPEEATVVRYVTSSGPLPRVKLIEEVPGTYWVGHSGGGVHHLTYWVRQLEPASAPLLAQRARIEADGLDESGDLRYRYLVLPSGLRVELGLLGKRAEFEQWANAV